MDFLLLIWTVSTKFSWNTKRGKEDRKDYTNNTFNLSHLVTPPSYFFVSELSFMDTNDYKG